ncbi:MAG: hypothetical protein UX92_C0029G0007 [Candidatus Amesbacteria bacterium GW2011_GWA1_47_20]|nr:MAG: hypothetical protein UX92_C0029G0007 [Candidatus Amesbacteria bacterium GW2011_GWA1_47_20]
MSELGPTTPKDIACCLILPFAAIGATLFPFGPSLCTLIGNLRTHAFTPLEVIGFSAIDLAKAALLTQPLLALIAKEPANWPVLSYAILTALELGVMLHATLQDS